MALAAGCDLLLFCHRQDWLRTAVEAVERAVADGRLPEARVADAYRRVTGSCSGGDVTAAASASP